MLMLIARHANADIAQKKGKDQADRVPDRDTRSAYTHGGHKGIDGTGR